MPPKTTKVTANNQPVQTPSVGRIVMLVLPFVKDKQEMYVTQNGGQKECAAIITNVKTGDEFTKGEVNLKAFVDSNSNYLFPNVPYSEGGEPNTWHWPVKV